MSFDIDAARKAGYSDDQIADGLAKLSGVDIDAARKAGYSAEAMLPGLVKAADGYKGKTSVWEDVKTGVAGIGNTVDQAATLAASNFVPEDNKGAMFDASQQRAAERNQWANPDNKAQSFGGKAVSAISTLPMQLATAPLNAIDTAIKFVNNGESLERAYTAAGVDAAFTAAGFAIPVAFGRTLLQKALTGGASNAIQYGLSKGIISQEIAEKPQTQAEFMPNAEDAGVAGIVGTGFGVHHGLDSTPAKQAARAIDSVDISNPDKFGPDWTPDAQARTRLNPNAGDAALISPSETVKPAPEAVTNAAPAPKPVAPAQPAADVAAALQAIRPFEENSLARGAVSVDLEKVQAAPSVDDAIAAANDIASGTDATSTLATSTEARRQLIKTPVSKRNVPVEEAENVKQSTDTAGVPLRDDVNSGGGLPANEQNIHEAGGPQNVQPAEAGPRNTQEVQPAVGDSVPDAGARVDGQPALTGSGTYNHGGAWQTEYATVPRSDGTVALIRKLTDSDGSRIQYIDDDGMWQKGLPSTTVVSGLSAEGGPAVFKSVADAINVGKYDIRDLPNGKEVSNQREPIETTVLKAKTVLTDAGVMGSERTRTVAAVRRGDLTVQDVEEAYPQKAGNSPLEKAQAKLAEGMKANEVNKNQESAADVPESAKIPEKTQAPHGEKNAVESSQEYQDLIKRGYSDKEAKDALQDTITAKPVEGEAAPEVKSQNGAQVNGSGESAASMEAVNRLSAEKAAGQDRVKLDTRTGEVTPLVTADRVDAKAGEHDVILQRNIGKDEWTVLDQGESVRNPTGAIARAKSEGKLGGSNEQESNQRQPFEYNNSIIYPLKVRGENRWSVQRPENKGTNKVLGDTIHTDIKDAKAQADRNAEDVSRAAAFKATENRSADDAANRREFNKNKSIAERRADVMLDKPTTLPPQAGLGNTTRRDAMHKAVEQGRAIVEKQVLDSAAKKRDEEAVARASRAGYMLDHSNPNIPLVKAAREARDRINANDYTKSEYRVYSGTTDNGPFFNIPKTAYDYAKTLPNPGVADNANKSWANEFNGKSDTPAVAAESGAAIVTPRVVSEEGYLAQNGAGRQNMGDAALHMGSSNVSERAKQQAIARQSAKDGELVQRRDELRAEYADKIAKGELRSPTSLERLKATAAGMPENEATQAAQRLLAKRGATDKTAEGTGTDASRETITPPSDERIGTNSNGEELYRRNDGSVYRMHAGKPDFGGDLVSTTTVNRVEYPAKMGESEGASATHEGQKAVVDFMNGDIDKDALIKRLGALDLYEGVIRSITNRIEDFNNGDVKKVLAAAPKEVARYTSRQLNADGTPKEGKGMTELNARQYARELNAKNPDVGHVPDERPDGMFDVVGKEKQNITLMHAGLSPMEAINKIKETELAKSATAKLGALLAAPKGALSDLRLMTVPMAEGSSAARAAAKEYANNERKAQWQWSQFDKIILKNFDDKQLRKMWDAADEENDLRREGITSATEGLNRLAPDERAVVETLHTYGEELMARAQANGMLESTGVHYWTPRMVALIGENGEITKPQSNSSAGPQSSSGTGRNISTYASSALHRKYDTSAETEAAAQGLAKEEGQTAVVVRNIRTMPMAMAKFERAIAARDLINQVKAIGAATGRETVLTGAAEKGDKEYFTLDHPAFKTWQPLFRDGAIVKDEHGDAVLTKVPLRISKEFEGPLKAVMSTTPSKAYLGVMALKSKSMGLIMYSPVIHNAVEWGRAFPAMDLKGKASLGVYTYLTGNAAKNNPAIMSEAIEHGLVPIGGRGQHMDITSMMGDPTLEVGKSLTAKVLAAPVALVSEKGATAVKRAVDAAGKFWHETLLWDRVADLQMGLYTSMKSSLINKGLPESDAAYVAAHFANRYAGALPRESMSSGASQLLNLALFSRTFTMGNLGAMKDMITGLPRDVQSQIKAGGNELTMQAARSQAKKIAIGTFVMDVGLMYAGNSLLQDWFEREKINGWKGWLQSYSDRSGALWEKLKTDPASVLTHPFNSIEGLTSTGQNEPGKEQRVKWGEDKTGTEIYLRLPTGKIGEEFKNYADLPSGAVKQFRAKESQFVRPFDQLITNDMGAGQKLYDTSKGASTMKNVGAVALNFLKAQVPTDQVVAAYDLIKGKGDDMDVKKLVGPLVGATFSKGAPGGPAVGELYAEQREHQDKVVGIMPDVHRALKYGNEDEAVRLMESVQMTAKEIGTTLKHIEQPESRLSPGAVRSFNKHATDAQKEKLNSLQK